MKKIILCFFTLIIFCWTTPGLTQDTLKTRKHTWTLEAFVGGSKEKIATTYMYSEWFTGFRGTIHLKRVHQIFFFGDLYYYKFHETDYFPYGPPTRWTEDALNFEGGVGFEESFQIYKGFGVSIMATYSLLQGEQRVPLPLVFSPGLYLEIKNTYFFLNNNFKLYNSAVWEPVLGIGYLWGNKE